MVIKKILGRESSKNINSINSLFGELSTDKMVSHSTKQMEKELRGLEKNINSREATKYNSITQMARKECVPFSELIRLHPDITENKNPDEIIDWMEDVGAPLACLRRKEHSESYGIKSAHRVGNSGYYDIYSQIKNSPSTRKLSFIGRVDEETRRLIGAEVENEVGTSSMIKVPTGRFVKVQ